MQSNIEINNKNNIINQITKYQPQNEESCVKAYFAQTNGKKINLDGKRIALPISVGQFYHEEENFLSTVNLLNEHHLEQCDIIVADSLQRHTLQLYEQHLNKSTAFQNAVFRGEAWIRNNKKYIEKIKSPVRILRWDQWLYTENYLKRRAEIENLVATNSMFHDIFYDTAFSFVARFKKNTAANSLPEDTILHSCMNYVMEECSIMSLWLPMNYHYEVYPGKRIKAMVLTHEYFIKQVAADMLQWLRIHFKMAPKPLSILQTTSYSEVYA